jgi:hypothetical protein
VLAKFKLSSKPGGLQKWDGTLAGDSFDLTDAKIEGQTLFGAIELAKGKAFGTGGRQVSRSFYQTWQLLERSGVTGMGGQMVAAAFLAEHGVGMSSGSFSPRALTRWLGRQSPRIVPRRTRS